jgi:alanine dehydrogenase
MRTRDTLILTRSDVAALLSLDDCIAAVESAFRAHAEGRTLRPGVLGVPSEGGGFHIKAAGLAGEPSYVAVKCNGNFSDNPSRFGLPAIQGVIILCNGADGRPLAVLDSIEVTIQRTGAATAVAARYLARPEAAVAAICGCGHQGRVQLRALARVLPLRQAWAFDVDAARARDFAAALSAELGLPVRATDDLAAAVKSCDVCVTCTPSRQAFLRREQVPPGCFVAGVGADNPAKQELHPDLLAGATLVVDVLEQCAVMGDLHHALEAGALSRADVHAELHEVIAGHKPGRRSPQEIVVFDSTGTALEDVAAAALVYERALREGRGLAVPLGRE